MSQKDINLKALKSIQLDILRNVDEYCNLNNIKYSLAYGTLLGAARHGGYIPWDDDIDIMMPREDYERFIQNFKSEHLKIYHHKLNKNYVIPFAKVVDERTCLIEGSSMETSLGVNIDVFPIDKCPLTEKKRNRWFNKKRCINFIYEILMYTNSQSKFKIKLIRNLIEIVCLGKAKSLFCCIMDNMAKAHENHIVDQMGILVTSDTKRTWMMPSEVFYHYTKIEFEGNQFNCIKNYPQYLTHTYGDWQKLPPLEKQVSHHLFKAFWKK